MIRKLLLYKDLIAICSMFIGGVLFLYTYFATKSSLEEAKCFLTANVSIAKHQSKMADLYRLERYYKEVIYEIREREILTIPEQLRLDNFSERRDEVKNELAYHRQQVREAEDRLASGSCAE